MCFLDWLPIKPDSVIYNVLLLGFTLKLCPKIILLCPTLPTSSFHFLKHLRKTLCFLISYFRGPAHIQTEKKKKKVSSNSHHTAWANLHRKVIFELALGRGGGKRVGNGQKFLKLTQCKALRMLGSREVKLIKSKSYYKTTIYIQKLLKYLASA